MTAFISIGIYLLNGLIGFQDFKERSISAWIVPALLVSFAFMQYHYQGLLHFSEFLPLNLLYLGIILGSILVYAFLKFKKWTNPFDRLVGWGDVWIMLAFAFILETQTYIFFLTLSSCVSLLIALIMKMRKPNEQVQFPLAGMMSVIYLVLCVAGFIIGQQAVFTSIHEFINPVI
ncbi:MAG: prepilin peptidase [Bacteroidota bacterium]